MTVNMYGSNPRELDDLLGSLDPDERGRTRLLDAHENTQMQELSINRMPQTSWGTIDWERLPPLERREVRLFEEAERLLTEWIRKYFSPDFPVVIFWGNLVVPSVEMPSVAAANHSDEILDTGYDLWIFGPKDAVLIEYYHEGTMTVWRVPARCDADAVDHST